MLIRILDAFFNHRLDFFWKLDFKEITITFQSKKTVSIFKDRTTLFDEDEHGSDEGEQNISVSIRSNGFGNDDDIYSFRLSASARALSFIDRNLPVDRMGQNRWMDFETGRVLNTDEVLRKFGHMLPNRLSSYSETPDWLSRAIGAADTHLIETQRLLSFETDDEQRYHGRVKSASTSVVEADALDLAERIGGILTDYANEAQKLDESFPKRIIDVFRTVQMLMTLKHLTKSSRFDVASRS
ncbi:putative ATPase [Ruegeria sp. TrichCH4B]|nr:putative ATPase [Ruegeria sp. TrichCH4B]